jgi:Fe-S oxidoreductase
MSTAAERATNAFLEQIDRPIAAFFESCVHCGMCAHACLFYTETGDPQYTPIHKLEPMRRVWEREFTLFGRVKKWLGLSKPVTEEELKAWEPLVYDSCTMCGRCSLTCPVGNDIVYMVRKMREGMVAAGFAPDGLKEASIRSVRVGSPMGVTLQALKAQIGHAEKEAGLKIPLDQEGADYLLLLSSNEIMLFPEFMAAAAKIFAQAGVSWTLCSTAFEATNSGIQIGSSDIAAQLVRPYPFKVQHILEVLDDLRAAGKLQTEGMEEAKLTFHDPCQIVRRGGVVEPPRNLLRMVASNFVEMEDPGIYNWCCGGGGGVSANERAEPLRLKVFSRKKHQLDQLGVSTVVTACSNCRTMLEEGLEHNHMQVNVVSLTEMLAEHLKA